MVETYFRSVQERYEAISSTPQFRASLELDHAPTLAHYASELRTNQSAERILFRDTEHIPKAAAGPDDLDTHLVSSLASEFVTRDGRIFAVAHVPLRITSQPVGDLIAAEPVSRETIAGWSQAEERARASSQRSLLGGGALAILAALAASLVLWRSILEPLRRLGDVASRIGAGDFTARMGEQRSDEIGDLSRTLDKMAERLERYDEDLNAQVAARTAQLVAALERAEEANRFRSELLARVSHEFRTPMNSILGMMELLIRSDTDAERRRLVESVDRAGNDLLGLIDGMLDLSASVAGDLHLESTDFDLLETVESTVTRLAPAGHGRGLEVGYHVAADVPRYVDADPNRLGQLIEILLANAIKFTQQGAVRLEVSYDRETRRTRFQIRDTGVGVPEGEVERIFEQFTQLDDPSQRFHDGVGLGLSLASSLAELMGSHIDVESEVGTGSTFAFELQLDLAARPAAEAQECEMPPELRVLVVEPFDTERAMLSQLLSELGVTCDVVSSQQDALDRARVGGYQLALVGSSSLPDAPQPDDLAHALRSAIDPPPRVVVLRPAGAISPLGVGETSMLRPVRRHELVAVLQDSSGHAAGEFVSSADAAAPAGPEARILLAEDNALNLELASQNLEARGWLVDTAADGFEAAAAAARQSYCAILMDLQMPGMDGLEATRAIRAQEVREGTPRVPIIALTANALLGSDRSCFEAGMDDYLSKPFRIAELDAKLASWARALPESQSASPPISSEPMAEPETAVPVLEPAVLAELRTLERGQAGVIAHLVDVYLQSTPELIERLKDAIVSDDALEAEQLAHQLKSSAANVAARGLAELFRRVEAQASAQATTKDCDATLVEIEESFELVRVALLRERGE
jgi:signal transduction histidine kinase/CheY-like chemotaxis protein/HPt (histidine-containing phosphotransfer) domain-containing protein